MNVSIVFLFVLWNRFWRITTTQSDLRGHSSTSECRLLQSSFPLQAFSILLRRKRKIDSTKVDGNDGGSRQLPSRFKSKFQVNVLVNTVNIIMWKLSIKVCPIIWVSKFWKMLFAFMCDFKCLLRHKTWIFVGNIYRNIYLYCSEWIFIKK